MEESENRNNVRTFSRKSLDDIMEQAKGLKFDQKITFLKDKLVVVTGCPIQERIKLNRSLYLFKNKYKTKWIAAGYKRDTFLKKNERWLSGLETLPIWTYNNEKTGRPSKDFTELCERSKRRKTKDLREQISTEELTFAARLSQRSSGNIAASNIIKELTVSPTRATKMRKVLSKSQDKECCKQMTPQEALKVLVEADLSKRQYEVIQKANKHIYPCYSRVQEAKKDCYPDSRSTFVTETSVEVTLQALLDHTTQRLCKHLEPIVDNLTANEKINLQLIVKWGCDGSQQTRYNQKFTNLADSDANIFQSSMVPIRLVVNSDGHQTKIIWQNPSCSSVWFCRPIRIRFVKETKEVTKEEISHIESQEKVLIKTEIPNMGLKINHRLLPTMVDGKICNAATDTLSTMRCYLCKQTSKDFNKLIKIKDISTEFLKFGLSSLHARIRFFESLLHISYKLPLKKWQIRTKEDKDVVETRKGKIQKLFWEELGLIVDVPMQGAGNSNCGNTSRRFFNDTEISSRITGLDLGLLCRFKVILEVITSGFDINIEKFEVYTQETAELYVALYGWHPMSPTVHKILMHGAIVIKYAINKESL